MKPHARRSVEDLAYGRVNYLSSHLICTIRVIMRESRHAWPHPEAGEDSNLKGRIEIVSTLTKIDVWLDSDAREPFYPASIGARRLIGASSGSLDQRI